MKRFPLLAMVGWLAASAASSAVLVPGTPVTGTLDGAGSGLLGADHGYEAVAGSNTTAVLDLVDGMDSLEFMAADFSFTLDLSSDGRLRLQDNTGVGVLSGIHVVQLSFADPALTLGAPVLANAASLLSGSVQLQLLGPRSVQLTLTDVQLDEPYAFVDAQLTLAPVPEPAPAALLALGLLTLSLRRSTQRIR